VRVLLTGTFHSDSWIRAHLRPLAAARRCREVTLVTTRKLGEIHGVRTVHPPRWLVRVAGDAGARSLVLLWLARRDKPDLVGGFHLLVNALAAQVAARLSGARSVYFCVAGADEVVGGGFRAENPVFGRMETPDRFVEAHLLRAVAAFDLLVTMGTGAAGYFRARGFRGGSYVVAGGVDGIPCERDSGRSEPAATTCEHDGNPCEPDGATCEHDGNPREPDATMRGPDGSRCEADATNRGSEGVPREPGVTPADIVVVGRLVPIKRLDVFVEALALACRRLPRVTATLVGDGPERPRLEEAARHFRVNGRLRFAGFRHDVRPWLAASRLCVLSSDSEGVPLALVEAMMSGLPAVATDVGDIRDLVEDGVSGILVPRRDPAALADGIVTALEDETRRAELGRRAREAALRYETRRVSAVWEGILARLDAAGEPAGAAAS
jgi:glycosyltransferase involved in cell wall biosynthesis